MFKGERRSKKDHKILNRIRNTKMNAIPVLVAKIYLKTEGTIRILRSINLTMNVSLIEHLRLDFSCNKSMKTKFQSKNKRKYFTFTKIITSFECVCIKKISLYSC